MNKRLVTAFNETGKIYRSQFFYSKNSPPGSSMLGIRGFCGGVLSIAVRTSTDALNCPVVNELGISCSGGGFKLIYSLTDTKRSICGRRYKLLVLRPVFCKYISKK